MSDALRIAHGAFGRVALLDMDRSLVRHARPHCQVLLKFDGDDTQFLVGDHVAPLTESASWRQPPRCRAASGLGRSSPWRTQRSGSHS